MDSTYKYEDGAKAAEEVLRRYPDTDGIIACNDMTAVSVYKVTAKKGIPGTGRHPDYWI